MDQIKSSLFLVSFSLLVACGGGSGGGDTAPSSGLGEPSNVASASPNQAYVGLQSSMQINQANANQLLDSAFGSGALDSVQNLSKPTNSGSTQGQERSVVTSVSSWFEQVTTILGQTNKTLPDIVTNKIDFDETISCDSGSFRAFGQLEDNATGRLTMSLNNCQFAGIQFSGSGEFVIDSFDISSNLITRGSIIFNGVTASIGSGQTYELNGEESYVLDQNGSEAEISSRFNMVISESGGSIVWFENFQEAATVNIFTNAAELTLSGRIYQSELGYVDVSTPATIRSRLVGADFALPDPGGEIRFRGRDSSTATITTFSSGVTLDIDADGDGVAEVSEDLSYDDVGIF